MDWHPLPSSSLATMTVNPRPADRVATTSHPLARPVVQLKNLDKNTTTGSNVDPSSRRVSLVASGSKASPWLGLDPLSAAAAAAAASHDHEDMDMESVAAAGGDASSATQESKHRPSIGSTHGVNTSSAGDEEWLSFKSRVLAKYTTTEKLSLKSSFLSPDEKTRSTSSGSRRSSSVSISSSSVVPVIVPVVPNPTSSASLSDQVRHRLQQLEDDEMDSLKEERGLSGREFGERISSFKRLLIESWFSDQRVKALKIVIQSAKLLSDSTVARFYPSLFVLITSEILDLFGRLVYERLEERAVAVSHELAVETTRNWMFKISSIRELIPRFYVEAAIIRSYKFLCPPNQLQENMRQHLTRLLNCVRGIADPLIASFARTFLARVALQVLDHKKHYDQSQKFFRDAFCEVFLVTGQFNCHLVQHKVLLTQRMSLADYVRLFSPTMTWVSTCILSSASNEDKAMDQAFAEFSALVSSCACSELNDTTLTAIANTLRPEFVVRKFDQIHEMMTTSAHPSSCDLLMGLGSCFSSASSSTSCQVLEAMSQEDKSRILRLVWEKVSHLPPHEYLTCTASWMEFVASNFGAREVNFLLNDVLKHVADSEAGMILPSNSGSMSEADANKALIVRKILSSCDRRVSHASNDSKNYILHLIAMESLQPFVQSIRESEVRVNVCRDIVKQFFASFQEFEGSNEENEEENELSEQKPDSVLYSDVVHSLSIYCKVLHDSVSAVSLEDERRDVCHLLLQYLRLVAFTPVLSEERKFQLLQDARADFYNMDPVLSFLVFAVNSLIMSGDHRRDMQSMDKRKDFIRSCLAYSFTTIPSIEDNVSKFQLYCQSAEVALSNCALSQLDSFLKSGMQLLSTWTPIEDNLFISNCRKLLTILFLTPDHPDHEIFYLFKGLLTLVNGHEFMDKDAKFLLLLDMATFLSTACQSEYPIHVPGVDSNDILYAGQQQELRREVSSLMHSILNDSLLDHLSQLTSDEKRQTQLSVLLMERLVHYSDRSHSQKLVSKLANLVLRKHQSKDTKITDRVKRLLDVVVGEE